MPTHYRHKTLYQASPEMADAPASPHAEETAVQDAAVKSDEASSTVGVEVFLTSANVKEDDVKGRTVVVVDVLRASSTIVTALHHGARSVVPVADMAQAGKIASNLDAASYLLGGERGGEKIEGYHLGNSPLEYTREAVEDRTIILTTTNGTVALERARGGAHVVVGAFLNAARVAAFVQEVGLDVTIVCAGWRDRVSLEDTLCAGLLLYLLWDGEEPPHASDTAHIAYTLYAHDRASLKDTLLHGNHIHRLRRLGFEDDVDYCLQVDHLPVLPIYADSRLVLKS